MTHVALRAAPTSASRIRLLQRRAYHACRLWLRYNIHTRTPRGRHTCTTDAGLPRTVTTRTRLRHTIATFTHVNATYVACAIARRWDPHTCCRGRAYMPSHPARSCRCQYPFAGLPAASMLFCASGVPLPPPAFADAVTTPLRAVVYPAPWQHCYAFLDSAVRALARLPSHHTRVCAFGRALNGSFAPRVLHLYGLLFA